MKNCGWWDKGSGTLSHLGVPIREGRRRLLGSRLLVDKYVNGCGLIGYFC
jgi:hypothetical protein